jgi:hypothetical protein
MERTFVSVWSVWSYFCLYWISNYLLKGFLRYILVLLGYYTMHGCVAIIPHNESNSNTSHSFRSTSKHYQTLSFILASTCLWLAFDLVYSFDMSWCGWFEEIERFANIIKTLEDWFGSDHIWSVALLSIGKGFKSSPRLDLLLMFLSFSLLSYVFSLTFLLWQAGYTWTPNKLPSRKQTDPSTTFERIKNRKHQLSNGNQDRACLQQLTTSARVSSYSIAISY